MRNWMNKCIVVLAATAMLCAANAQSYFQTIDIPKPTAGSTTERGVRELKAAETWEGAMTGFPPERDTYLRHVFEIQLEVKSSGTGGLGQGELLVELDGSGTVCRVGIMEGEGRGIDASMSGLQAHTWPIESGPNPQTATFLACNLTASGTAKLHVTSEDVLAGGTIHVMCYRQFKVWNETSQEYDYYHRYELVEYDLDKILVSGDSAMDTRMGYFNGNGVFDGVNWPDEDPDINAAAAFTKFGGWKYRGGLFAGFMPFVSMDRSGLARTQLFGANGMTTGNDRSCLTMLYMGRPAAAPTTVTFGAYLPLFDDDNIGQGEGGLTWATRWSIIPTGGNPPDPEEVDYSAFPVSKLQFTGSPAEGYFSWPLWIDDETIGELEYGSGVCIAIHDEDETISGLYVGMWRYFASKEFETEFSSTGFPYTDCAPRIWKLTVVDYAMWSPPISQ